MSDHKLKRRDLLTTTGAVGVAASAFPSPAISLGLKQWRLASLWPLSMPGFGVAARRLAELITQLSGQRLTVTAYGAGELLPAHQTLDAVSDGMIEMSHGIPYYWAGREPAMEFLAAMPFHAGGEEMRGWMAFGEGLVLARQLYERVNCQFFMSGSVGETLGGWFQTPFETVDEFTSLHLRMPGLGGAVLESLGMRLAHLPHRDIVPAMSSHAIDGAVWMGPDDDVELGLPQVSRFCMDVGWHEPDAMMDTAIYLPGWNALEPELKLVVEVANRVVDQEVRAMNWHRNKLAHQKITGEFAIPVQPWPEAVLSRLKEQSDIVLSQIAGQDPLSLQLLDSRMAFREAVERNSS